jgi:sterol desaturase/sphingolipid hydroxylase (fatty acid hydroxylase superfamily)
MLSLSLDSSTAIRLLAFAVIVVLIVSWELLWPRRALKFSRLRRWPNNYGISALNSVMLSLVLPVLAVGAALWAERQGWGLFNQLALPAALTIPAFVILFDLAIYWQHRLYHQIPWLWRLHRTHHADGDFDASTGVRFHPLSILISMLIKIAIVLILGPPALAVLLAEILLNVTAVFNHGNIYIPPAIDSKLRLLLVTPDMHRVHHSTIMEETNSNFGFNFPWWDRLFGSYRQAPEKGHVAMDIGVEGFAGEGETSIGSMLSHPFRKGVRPL